MNSSPKDTNIPNPTNWRELDMRKAIINSLSLAQLEDVDARGEAVIEEQADKLMETFGLNPSNLIPLEQELLEKINLVLDDMKHEIEEQWGVHDSGSFNAVDSEVHAVECLMSLFHSHMKVVIDEVIGEDDTPAPGYRLLTLSKKHKNDLREEERNRIAKYLSSTEGGE